MLGLERSGKERKDEHRSRTKEDQRIKSGCLLGARTVFKEKSGLCNSFFPVYADYATLPKIQHLRFHVSLCIPLFFTISPFIDEIPLTQNSKSSRINQERYKTNVKIVAEAVAKYVYDLHEKDLNIFEGTNDVSTSFLSSWLSAVASLPRTESHVAQKDADGNALLLALQKVRGESRDHECAFTNAIEE